MKNLITAALVALIGFGCGSAETHSSRGVIQGIKNNGAVLVIQHEEFPGFMEAMTMPFELKDMSLSKGLSVGDTVEFTLEKTEDAYPIVKITKTGSSPAPHSMDPAGHSHTEGTDHQH